MKDNHLDLSSKKVQDAILQSLRNKNKPAKSEDQYFWGYDLDGGKIYKDNNPSSEESFFHYLNRIIKQPSYTDLDGSKIDDKPSISASTQQSKSIDKVPSNHLQTPAIKQPMIQAREPEIQPFYIDEPKKGHTSAIKRPDSAIQQSEVQPFYIDEEVAPLKQTQERPQVTNNNPAESKPYYFKDWLKDYMEKAPGSVKPNMRLINTGLRGSEIYNMIRTPYALGKLQIEAFNRARKKIGSAYDTISNHLPNWPRSTSISEAIESANSSSDISFPSYQNEPTLSDIVQSTLPITQQTKNINEPVKTHTAGIQMPKQTAQPGNQPFYVNENKAENINNPLSSPAKISSAPNTQDEWQATPGAFYERGINDVSDLSGYNVWDAPKGYKWVPFKDPDFHGFRGSSIQDPRGSSGSLLGTLGSLFTDTEATNSRPESQYAYKWRLQQTNEQRPPTMSELAQQSNNIFSNAIEQSQETHTAGIQMPEQSAQPQNQPFYVNAGQEPPLTNNNELALYGAPVPITGTLPPLSSQPMPSTSRNNQVIPSPEMPRRQGNAGMGTLGETPGAIPSGSFKQTALYSLFGNPQTGKASTNNFVF